MKTSSLALPAVVLALAMAGCNGIRLTAPLPTRYIMHLTIKQQTLEQCDAVELRGDSTGFGYATVFTERDANEFGSIDPYHLGPRAKGYLRTPVREDEYTGKPRASSLTLKRAGTYVYQTRLAAGADPFPYQLTCQKNARTFEIRTGDGLPTDYNSPIVFQIMQLANGNLTGNIRPYPEESTPEQLGLP